MRTPLNTIRLGVSSRKTSPLKASISTTNVASLFRELYWIKSRCNCRPPTAICPGSHFPTPGDLDRLQVNVV